MIELPEAHSLAKQIEQHLSGRVIRAVEAAKSPHGFAFYNGDPAEYPRLLLGKTVGPTHALAGMVEMEIEDMRFLFHDGAVPRLYAPGEKRPLKHQMRLGFDDGSDLIFTVQMYGALFAYPAGSLENIYYQIARDSVSPLTDAFDRAHFDALVAAAKPSLSAKGLLATEQRIPGLGNGCLQDILFLSGVNPRTRCAALTDAELDKLFSNVKSVLSAMTRAGGRDTEKNLMGAPGGYRTLLSNKTYPYPCPSCAGGILRKAYMGGNVYWCPACQPEKK